MDIEKKNLKLIIDEKQTIFEELFLYEEAPDDEDMVCIEMSINGQKFSFKSENFFSALQALRAELEQKKIQILCNGAAKIVYPSQMQMSMGSGRKAYKLNMGQQAKNSDILDIFDCNEELDFVDMSEQLKYYVKWIESVME